MADGDQTLVLTSNDRAKINQTPNEDVWEIVATATYDSDDTTDVTLAVPLNGTIEHVTLKVPDTTNAITTQLQIQDNGDNVIFDTGELAENDTYNFSTSLPVSGTIDLVIGVSGAVGATGSIIVATVRGR